MATANPLTLSPAFSSSNLSELSDFELIDQDREAWSSTDVDSQSESDEDPPSSPHNSSASMLNQHADHGTDAWNSMHLVDAHTSQESIVERNERVAEQVERDAASVDDFTSAAENAELRESADRTLTDIDIGQPDLDKNRSSGAAISQVDLCAASHAESAPSGAAASNIALLFPDPIEGSIISIHHNESLETLNEPDIETDAQSSVLFASVSSLSSLSRNPSAISFSTPVGVDAQSENESYMQYTNHIEEIDELHFLGAPLLPPPFEPPRDAAEEVTRPLSTRASLGDTVVCKGNGKDIRRLEYYTSKRNLIVSVLSVIVCSAACLLYGWKATVSKFETGLDSVNRTSSTSTSLLPTPVRSATPPGQDASKPSTSATNSYSTMLSASTSAPILTLDPTPVLQTIDAPERRLLISAPNSAPQTTAIGPLLPNSISKFIPTTSGIYQHSSLPSFSFMAPLKHKLGEAHSRLSERHQRAKANAKKLGALGKKVWNERCVESVGEALGKLRVGVAGIVGEG